MDYQGIKIEHLEHDGFYLEMGGKRLFIDPFNLKPEQVKSADLVLITHEHFDHCSPTEIKKIAGRETIILAPTVCQDQLKSLRVKEIIYVDPNQSFTLGEIIIETTPAYNLNKFRSKNLVYHPKADGQVGYVIQSGKVRLYHAGDTDCIPEMSKLVNIDVAFLPVSGTYVMDWQEATKAIEVIKPKIAVPMHWGAVIGSRLDAEKFKKAAACQIEII
jgi:L-ascorbate metabolism protein UlaG (beta-lactamase superfamily)